MKYILAFIFFGFLMLFNVQYIHENNWIYWTLETIFILIIIIDYKYLLVFRDPQSIEKINKKEYKVKGVDSFVFGMVLLGCWVYSSGFSQVVYRGRYNPEDRFFIVGFRLCLPQF